MEPTDTPFSEMLVDLSTYLNDDIVANRGLQERIGTELGAGLLVIIRNAFKDAFAEKMYACLDSFAGWRLYEDYSDDHFHYRHHNIYDHATEPAELGMCREIFDSRATRGLIERLSGRECSGRTVLSSSWYMPGDYSLPHTDRVGPGASERRQVAFVWHLTKGWDVRWGGDLFWCPAGHYLTPTFNTLNVFNVDSDSMHFVTPVSPHAQSKRLAINGWWTGPDAAGMPRRARHAPSQLATDVEAV